LSKAYNEGNTVQVKRIDTPAGDLRTDHPLKRFHEELDRMFEDAFKRLAMGTAFGRKTLPAPEVKQIII
jgi:hypothetical protein